VALLNFAHKPWRSLGNLIFSCDFKLAPCNYNGSIKGSLRCASVDSAAVSLTSAEPHVGGGITRDIRCICAISAAMSKPPAVPKSHFGGYKGAVRLSFQRTNVQNMQIVQ
jgi:hypothetical protein